MSPYDILILVVFGGAILFGLWKGLAWQIASLAAVVVSYFVALNFKQPLMNLLKIDKPYAPFLAMLIIYLVTSLGIWLAYGYIRENIKRLQLKSFDAQAGGLLGAVKGAILCMVITMFAVTLLGDNARRYVVASRSGGLIANAINQLNAVVPVELHTMLDPFVQKFNQNLAAPLPRQSEPSGSGWPGSFINQSGITLSNTSQPIEGSFLNKAQSNSSIPDFSVQIAPGINTTINGQQTLNQIGERFQQKLNNSQRLP